MPPRHHTLDPRAASPRLRAAPMKALLASLLLAAAAAPACDLCGTTLIQHPWDPRAGFTIGASEQFTRMGSLYQDGREIDNDADQKLDSSITQIFLGYHFTPTLGVQVNVPLIRRTFRRATEAGIEEGSVQGLGDVAVTVNWLAINHRKDDFTFQFGVNAGVKFATGDSDRVKEEAEHHEHGEEEPESEFRLVPTGMLSVVGGVIVPAYRLVAAPREGGGDDEAENEIPEGVHGHDLALGTGSIDLMLGATFHARWKRIFFTGELQYALRGDGEHSYDYGDDLMWSGGPGVTLIDRETHTLSMQFICSGETKSEDEFRGVRSNDTAMTQVFLGPKISGTWRDRFSAEVELDVPVHQENSGVQIAPDYRLRAALSWSF